MNPREATTAASPVQGLHADVVVHTLADLEQLRAEARAAQRLVVDLRCEPGRITRIEACPGAGKTRTIIDRHLNRPLGLRQGRAIVSFTKAASTEVAQRCAQEGRPELAEYPHFIGTLDSFLWTHLVRPHISSPRGQRWRRVESWGDHPKARKDDISLDDFHFTPDSGHGARIRNPRWKKMPYALTGNPDRQKALLYWAKEQMLELWETGFIASEQLRDISLFMLREPKRGPRIAALLASRFAEIIVDESQDLSSEDQCILDLLSSQGVPMLTVGDPNQSIYRFRETMVGTTARMASVPTLPVDLRLGHNWRSTQIICDLARTLRATSAPADIAVGDHRGEFIPVLLLGISSSGTGEALRTFEEEADRLAIRHPAQRMVLAYKHATLSAVLANVAESPPSSQLSALVWATAVLRELGTEGKRRDKAERIFSETIRRHWLGDVDVPEREHLERHGISALELRLATQVVLHSLPALDEPAGDWSRAAFQALTDHAFGHLSQPAVARAFPCPKKMQLKPAIRLASTSTKARDQTRGLRGNTIHGVKGEQFDAVLVLMPPAKRPGKKSGPRPDGLVDTWISGRREEITDDAAEALRVHYVAATRARRLLAFAVGQEHVRGLEKYLSAHGVPVSVR